MARERRLGAQGVVLVLVEPMALLVALPPSVLNHMSGRVMLQLPTLGTAGGHGVARLVPRFWSSATGRRLAPLARSLILSLSAPPSPTAPLLL